LQREFNDRGGFLDRSQPTCPHRIKQG
jgi:hypothetical protein